MNLHNTGRSSIGRIAEVVRLSTFLDSDFVPKREVIYLEGGGMHWPVVRHPSRYCQESAVPETSAVRT